MVSKPSSHTSIINSNSFFKNILAMYLKLRVKGGNVEANYEKKITFPFFPLCYHMV
jgi:hypothetical protein